MEKSLLKLIMFYYTKYHWITEKNVSAQDRYHQSFLISCISPKNNEQLENNFDDGS